MQTLRGTEGFEQHYSQLFGVRWTTLKSALLKPVCPVARINAFADPRDAQAFSETLPVFSHAPQCRILTEPLPIGKDRNGLSLFYPMDAASLFPALLLEVKPGENVLDLCAAPGGKTLILAEAWRGEGLFVANDLSGARRQRLKRTLADYLPRHWLEKIKVTGMDAAHFGLREKDTFDAVLLDAPCSSERHVLQDPSALALWSPARVKHLAIQQYSLLCSGLQALRPGGRLLYSTCALNPAENDGVIEKLLTKNKHPARVEPLSVGLGEKTRHGWQILPDQDGWGPMYFSKLRKE